MKLFLKCLVLVLSFIYVTASFGAVTVTVNGSNHTIPQTNEKGWGANVTAWIQAISASTLQPSGGNFTLTADTNFGANFGLLSTYYKSRSSNISSAGIFRLSNTDQIGFRNAANSGNLLLGVDSSDRLTFNGSAFLPTSALTGERLLVSDASGVVSASGVTVAEASFLSGVESDLCGIDGVCTLTNKTLNSPTINTPSGIVKADVGLGNVDNTSDATKNAAAVTLTNKTLTSPIISEISNTGTLTLPTSTDTLVGRATTDTLTNKTATNIVLNGTLSGTAIKDEDDMVSDSATAVPTQQSVKAYVDANAGGFGAIQTKTGSYTALTSDGLILCSGAAFTVTLYTAVGNAGRQIIIKKTDSSLSNIITIDGDGTETIDGTTTTTLNTVGEAIELVSDGANWQILDRRIPSVWSSSAAMTITATTSNPTKGTGTTVDTIRWKRVGDSMYIQAAYKHTVAGSAGTGVYLIALPGSQSADTGDITDSTEIARPVIGTAALFISSNPVAGYAKLYDTTRISLVAGDAGNNPTSFSSTFAAFSNATVVFSFEALVPISGWND